MLPCKCHWEERINSVTGGKRVRKMKAGFHRRNGASSDFERGIFFFFKFVPSAMTNGYFLSGQSREGYSR